MANYSEHLAIKKAMVLAGPLIEEEQKLDEIIRRCETLLIHMRAKEVIEWDLLYLREQQLVEAKERRDALGRRIVDTLRPIHPSVWQLWWEIANMEDPKPEHETYYAKIDRQARWVSEQIFSRSSPEEIPALEKEQSEMPDEEMEAFFQAVPLPEDDEEKALAALTLWNVRAEERAAERRAGKRRIGHGKEIA